MNGCNNWSSFCWPREHVLAAGGLLSTHVMLERRPSAVPDYDGCLLLLATDLADRLLPAFDTKSGIPLSWVHLRQVTTIICRACLL